MRGVYSSQRLAQSIVRYSRKKMKKKLKKKIKKSYQKYHSSTSLIVSYFTAGFHHETVGSYRRSSGSIIYVALVHFEINIRISSFSCSIKSIEKSYSIFLVMMFIVNWLVNSIRLEIGRRFDLWAKIP